ncbi:hypothetical protein D1BOALGB6SA_9818 [Olavius sp. associated proteobacterium Delta 1]|nr:hypothetical protein D1BOALGB6SA_9818 [Olavius sp. associated proteobacterium Delta 1]
MKVPRINYYMLRIFFCSILFVQNEINDFPVGIYTDTNEI